MDIVHYIITGAIIIIVIYFQLRYYFKSTERIKILSNIFPKEIRVHLYDYCEIEHDSESGQLTGIKTKHKNPVLEIIINSINNYIQNNKGAVSDFHLIKDIVDRNCDSAEEEIQTLIPVPLYFGLMGTMAGITVGVGFLVGSGGLEALLDSGASSSGADGIYALLSGVALAMISSIIGILLTTVGSAQLRKSKAETDRTKNNFLSWIHSSLLPELTTDMTSVLEKMTRNLASFNSTFSVNTKELRSTLELVNQTSKGQTELLQSINQLKIKEIAKANISVYDKLKGCTDEIGYFSTYLRSVNTYIEDVRKLNDKLDANETRTKAIEDMGAFFMQERANMESWNGVVSKSIGQVDSSLQQAVSNLKLNIAEQFNELVTHTANQNDGFKQLVTNQFTTIDELKNHMSAQFGQLITHTEAQRVGFEKIVDNQITTLEQKSKEIVKIIDELHNISAVKTSLHNLEKATNDQNNLLKKLTESISELAYAKTGATPTFVFPKWVKYSFAIGIGFVVFSTLFFVIIRVLSLIGLING